MFWDSQLNKRLQTIKKISSHGNVGLQFSATKLSELSKNNKLISQSKQIKLSFQTNLTIFKQKHSKCELSA